PRRRDLLSLRRPLRAGDERRAERVTMDREFSIAEGGLSFPLPKWRRIAQSFEAPRVNSIPETVAREMRNLEGRVRPGMSVAIGFGKQKGAATVHKRGFDTFHEVVPETARLVFEKVNVLGGVASVENALEDVAHLEVVPGDRIASREPELMRLSRSLMPRIPFDRLDVLVVDYLGKDISGMGMDPNVTGRYAVRHIVDPRNPKKLAVLRLTELTHGNACGLGVADVTTRAVVENIDYQKYWTN